MERGGLMGVRSDARYATLTLISEYSAALEPPISLNTYPGRPKSIRAPHAFVDRVSGSIDYSGPESYRNPVTVELVLLHGLFDSKEAVDQADRFVDGFVEYIADKRDAAGANRTIGLSSIEDDPSYVADWITPGSSRGESQGPYFATRISLEVYAAS